MATIQNWTTSRLGRLQATTNIAKTLQCKSLFSVSTLTNPEFPDPVVFSKFGTTLSHIHQIFVY
jgi:hypothetical protein